MTPPDRCGTALAMLASAALVGALVGPVVWAITAMMGAL